MNKPVTARLLLALALLPSMLSIPASGQETASGSGGSAVKLAAPQNSAAQASYSGGSGAATAADGSAPGGRTGSVFRIKREPAKPLLYGNIQHNKILPEPQVLVPLEGGLDSAVKASDYSMPAFNAAASVNAPLPRAGNGKHLWGQSDAGGYYDATGQMTGTIMGDELYKFGGTFTDGTPVPAYPAVCNFKGHVYKPYVRKQSR